jgi:hypothetical protein
MRGERECIPVGAPPNKYKLFPSTHAAFTLTREPGVHARHVLLGPSEAAFLKKLDDGEEDRRKEGERWSERERGSRSERGKREYVGNTGR